MPCILKDLLLECCICAREAVVLPKVFSPRCHLEYFKEDIGAFDVAKDAPAKCAIATAHAPVLLHGAQEALRITRRHLILHCDENRAFVQRRRGVPSDRWHAPVIPATEVDWHVRKSGNVAERSAQDG